MSDISTPKDVVALMQPVMGAVYNTRHLGDILLTAGKKIGAEKRFPWNDFYALLNDTWEHKLLNTALAKTWEQAMQQGGLWEPGNSSGRAISQHTFKYSFPLPDVRADAAETVHFITYPTIQFFDGRSANRPWLQELPDPLTQITWGNWIEIWTWSRNRRLLEPAPLNPIRGKGIRTTI